MKDYNSFYKYTIRNIIIHKYGQFTNSYQIPSINKIIYTFRLYKLEDLDDIQIYNYLYYFKFFFGGQGYLTKYKSFFNLGIWTYTLRVCMYIVHPMIVYENTHLVFDEYLINIDRNAIVSGFYTKSAKIYYIILKDLNSFPERKTNIGLFNLSTNLLITLYLSNSSAVINKLLPKNAKLIFNRL